MTDKPEAVHRWPFKITGYAPSHRQLCLPESLTPEQITAATGVEPVQRPAGDKATLQWTFWAEWTYSVPGATDGGFATHCKIWDYNGARWSAFGPPEVFRQIGLEPILTTDYGSWHYDEDGNRLVEYVDAALCAKHTNPQPDASALVEALRAILNVRADRDDNIWAGAARCKDIARAALTAWEQSNG